MGEVKDNDAYEEELLDYEEEDEKAPDSVASKAIRHPPRSEFFFSLAFSHFRFFLRNLSYVWLLGK